MVVLWLAWSSQKQNTSLMVKDKSMKRFKGAGEATENFSGYPENLQR